MENSDRYIPQTTNDGQGIRNKIRSLNKELEEARKRIEELQTWKAEAEKHMIDYGKLVSAYSELEKENAQLRTDRDKFAADFSKQIAMWGYTFIPELKEWRLYSKDKTGWNTFATEQLLEEYKKQNP